MNGSRKRVTGILSGGPRGLILTTDDRHIWVVETDDDVAPMLNQRVVVEGALGGLDRLNAYWIGEA